MSSQNRFSKRFISICMAIILLLCFAYVKIVAAEEVEGVVDTNISTTTDITTNMCAPYKAEPMKMYTEDVFDRETFIGVASTSIKNISLSYLNMYSDASSTPNFNENVNVTAFTPKTWYSHHPTDSVIFFVQRNSASSTAGTDLAAVDFKTGERYVMSGNFLKNASSSNWTFADSLESIASGSSTAKIMLNNDCVKPMKVDQMISSKLGKPLVSYDKYNYTRTLGLGMSGPDVSELNILLGVYPRYLSSASSTLTDDELEMRNYFGKQTRTSLINYQQANAIGIGIRVATGFFGEKTIAYVNALQTNNLANEISCAVPVNPGSDSISSILYDYVPSETRLISGRFEYASSTRPGEPTPIDLSYFITKVTATTTEPSVLARVTDLIASTTKSLDVLVSDLVIGSSTPIMPYDSVKQFGRYLNGNSIVEGKTIVVRSLGKDKEVLFPRAIACGR